MRKMRTVLALMLVLSLCLTMFPASIFAQTDDPIITEPVPASETLVTEPEVEEEVENDLADAEKSVAEVLKKAPVLEKSTVEVESLVKDAPAEESKNAMPLEESVKAEGSKTDEKEADVFPGTDTSVVINPNNPLTLDADTGNNDENDDNGDDSTVDYSLTIVWGDADNINELRPDIEKIKDVLDLHQAIGTGGKDKLVGPPDDFEKDGNKYVFTWHKLQKEVNGNTCRYYVEVKSMPEIPGYLHESNEAGNLYTYTLDTIDFVVTIRWEDNNDEYGNRPSTADCAEKMEMTLWSDQHGKDYTPPAFFNRTPAITDNGDNTYSVIWKDLPSSYDEKEINYIARESNPFVSGYYVTYENSIEHKVQGAYKGDTIVNKTRMVRFAANKVWEDAENKDKIRPTEITARLFAGEKELESKKVKAEDSWSGAFDGVYPEYQNGEFVEYRIVEDPVQGYRTEITEAFAEADIDDPAPIDDIEEEAQSNSQEAAKAVKRVMSSSSEGTADPSILTRVFKVTNIRVIDITVVKVWDDEDNVDRIRPSLEEFVEEYIEILVKSGSGIDPVIRPITPERPPEQKKVAAASSTETKNGYEPTQSSEDGNTYTVVWKGLDKYRGNEEIGYTYYETPIEGYSLVNDVREATTEGIVWTLTNKHEHETCTFSVTKYWEDGNDKDGDRPTSITLYLNADGEKIDTLTISPDENGEWAGSFEGDYPKYKNGEEIKYTITEEPIEGYLTEILRLDYAGAIDEGGAYENAKASDAATQVAVKETKATSELAAKEVEAAVKEKEKIDDLIPSTQEKVKDPVTKYEYEVTNTKVVDVTVTKQWWDENNRDGKRPSAAKFASAVGLKLHAILGDKIISQVPNADARGPLVEENEDGSYTITWKNMPKYGEAKDNEYQEYRYYVDESLKNLRELGYSSESSFDPNPPSSNPYQEQVYAVISGAAENGKTLVNEHTPEKVSVTVTKSWDDNNNPNRPECVTVDLFANGEKVWDEPKILSEDNDWTVTVTNLYRCEGGKEIDYTVEEEQLEGYAKPDYSKTVDENSKTILLNISNSLPTTISITKRWEDNDNEDGNRPTPDQLIESKAFTLRRTIDLKNYDYDPDGFDPEIIDNRNNTYTVTWKDLPKYKDGRTWLYSVSERDINNYVDDGINVEDGYFLTSSRLGKPDPLNWETESWPMDNGKSTWIFNGGSFTNTYRRVLVQLRIQKLWDDNDNAHRKRPESITVLLTDDSSEEPVRTVEIRPDEKGNWEVVLTDLQRYRDGEVIKYDIEELAVEGYHTTYKNSLIPDPVDPSNPGNPTVDPGEWGEVVVPVTPGEDQVQQVAQAQQEYQDTRKVVKMAAKAVAESKSGVVIDEIPQQTSFVLESITITNKEYCTARWVDENGTLIPPTEDGKYKPVEFDYDAEKVPDANTYGNGPDKEGYTFTGWVLIENWDGDDYKPGDITYQATYTQDAIVRYHSNYPSELEKTDLTKDEFYSEKRPYTIADLERVGFEDLLAQNYAFRGWTTREDGTGDKYAAGVDYPVKASAAGSSAVSFALMGIRFAASSSEGDDPTIELELWAQWEKVHVAKWVDENGVTPIEGFDPVEITDPDNPPADNYYKETLGDPAPKEDGREFVEWIKIIERDEEGNPTGNIIYQAVYESEDPGTDDPTDKINTVTWVDEDGTVLHGPVEFDPEDGQPADTDYNELYGNANPTKSGYTFAGWTETKDEDGNVVYTATYTPISNNNDRPRPTTNTPAEEVSEIENNETPLAPATVEEEDTNIDDGDVPLAGVEEEEEIAEEATPLTPFTGDERNTAVWGIVSILSLLGIVLLTYKRRREE